MTLRQALLFATLALLVPFGCIEFALQAHAALAWLRSCHITGEHIIGMSMVSPIIAAVLWPY